MNAEAFGGLADLTHPSTRIPYRIHIASNTNMAKGVTADNARQTPSPGGASGRLAPVMAN